METFQASFDLFQGEWNYMKNKNKLIFALIGLMLHAERGYTELKLPSIISDNMVMQQGKQVFIWGWSETSEKISISLSGYNHRSQAVADEKGYW